MIVHEQQKHYLIIIAKHSLAQVVIILWKVGDGVGEEGQIFIVGK